MPATVVALPTPDRRAEAANEALRWLTIEHLRTIREDLSNNSKAERPSAAEVESTSRCGAGAR